MFLYINDINSAFGSTQTIGISDNDLIITALLPMSATISITPVFVIEANTGGNQL
jgi:hypothetical protein